MAKEKNNQNDFIVDVSNARKSSEIIYEINSTLSMPDAQNKNICLKLGSVNLSASELQSIRALVECMNSKLKFICTDSADTIVAANELNIKISEIPNKLKGGKEKTSAELEKALDKIFGDDYFDAGDYEYDEKPVTRLEMEDSAETPEEKISEKTSEKPSDKPAAKEKSADKPATDDSVIIMPPPAISLEDEVIKAIEGREKDEYRRTKNEPSFVFDDNGNDITEEVRQGILATEKLQTLYIQRNIRSGQSVRYDGNIVVIGSAHPGCEIVASGDITVWGILGGIAHAGAALEDEEYNRYARVRALKMNAIQLRIADVFARRPDSVNLPYIQKSESFIPEEASIKNSRIIIQKLYEE